MLILSRRTEESIMIGDNIRIKVLEVHGDMVRLGIEAPRDLKVYRTEIYEEIKKQNAQAASTPVDALSKLMGALKKEQKD